ncbi:MaoC family dehydratase N-terminal domain-containing protein [Geodermatophilus sp. YIM 151500]|uniref:FAS1-like dehydratase domain-containing protein n=1 Tax=Geodermatophilus sp. YIM 151500 TaxID=2984531 RepID=UPI0021E41025|nr:MaoC family dehydratase N-terminal domain-containing protein [Geodermatophilus sp. YIM 151500]MCV2489300.1 MaoC family dehydratase N-terminal domain-containing protein [Geodermatophilus sp. YIM 151500]
MTATTSPRVGDEIGPLEVRATTLEDLVRWAGAIDDYSPIHFDPAAARDRGLPGVVVNGPWKAALLSRLLTDWLGESGTVTGLRCEYRRPDVVGGTVRARGVVSAVTRDGAYECVACEVWIEDGAGERTVVGTATLRTRRPETGGAPPADGHGRAALIGDRLRDALRVGAEAGRFTYRVEAGDLARFVHAVGGRPPAETVGTHVPPEAPPTYYAVLDPVERRELQLEELLDELPFAKTGGGNAFNEVEYERPIRVGDVLTVVTTYEEPYERDGRAGRLLFRVRRNDVFDADGHLVARSRMGHVLAYDLDRVAGR